jgi:predicted acylesterase/phospholipase RssA
MRLTDRQPGMALALAGGGPLGAVYEIGVLMALSEALDGFDFNELDAYVGVSAGGFIAAGLANGLSPAYLYRTFIDSDSAEVPFEPEMLLKPAIGEFRTAPRRFRRCCSNPCVNICAVPCSGISWLLSSGCRRQFRPVFQQYRDR